jgi:hypothetical protein
VANTAAPVKVASGQHELRPSSWKKHDRRRIGDAHRGLLAGRSDTGDRAVATTKPQLFIKISTFLRKLEPRETLEEETKLSLMLANGSRIIALPGDNSRTVRGFSAPALVIEDEAAFVSDATYDALIPMLAASPDGRIVLMSTPNLSFGHFYEIWHNGDGGWERFEHPTTACSRVSPAWLEARRREDPLRYDREYLARFGAGEGALFTAEMVDAMAATDFEPLRL